MSQNEMHKFIQILKLSLGAVLSLSYCRGQALSRWPAAIPKDILTLAKPKKIDQGISTQLIADFQSVKASEKAFDAQDILPMDMKPTENSGEVFSKVADRSVSSFFNSNLVRATPVGVTATKVEKKLKQEVIVESAEIQHKFSFQVQAFQSIAKIVYTGLANITFQYRANEESFKFELLEPIALNQELIISHITKPSDQLSSVAMQWKF